MGFIFVFVVGLIVNIFMAYQHGVASKEYKILKNFRMIIDETRISNTLKSGDWFEGYWASTNHLLEAIDSSESWVDKLTKRLVFKRNS